MNKSESQMFQEYGEVALALLKLLFIILELVVQVVGMIILYGGFLK